MKASTIVSRNLDVTITVMGVAYTPPKTGPRTRPMPKQATASPTRSVFVLNDEIVTRMVMPLLATPAAPIPATARPAILSIQSQHLLKIRAENEVYISQRDMLLSHSFHPIMWKETTYLSGVVEIIRLCLQCVTAGGPATHDATDQENSRK